MLLGIQLDTARKQFGIHQHVMLKSNLRLGSCECRLLDDTWISIKMELPKTVTHSFIIRIWLEETAVEADKARWRGHITHIPSNQRRYIENLDAVKQFIIPYLQSMGVESNT